MFQIENGRQEFWQWDINQRIIVNDDSITELHYCNKTDNCSLVTEVYKENGKHFSNVPNILLQNDWRINIYGWDKNHTKHYKCFKVNTRSKPTDYVYNETDIFTVEKVVEEKVEEAKKDLTPEKGVDYWTEEDKAEVVKDTLETLPINKGEGENAILQRTYGNADNLATGINSVAMGAHSKAIGDCSTALNYNNEVKGQNAFAANSSNKIGEGHTSCFVAGHCNETADAYQAIIGTYANVEVDDAFVVGNGYSGKKNNAFKVDKSGNAFVTKTLVADTLNANRGLQVNGGGRIANSVFGDEGVNGYGTRSIVEGEGSVAFNRNNYVGGKHCFVALSSNNIPQGFESVFIAGHANTAVESHQAIFGTYAKPEKSDAFIVGCGSSGNNKNGFVVDRVGNIRIGGSKITIGSTTITEEQLKKLLQLI